MYTILHLETSNLYKTLIREISTEISAKYLNTGSSEEALQIIEKEEISLILTALELEEGNSLDFIKLLNNSEYRNIPVVVITGNDTLEDRKKMYDLGIVDFILKKAGRDLIKQSLIGYRKDDPISLKMSGLSYAVLDDSRMDRKIIERIFSMHDIKNVDYFESEQELFNSITYYDVYLIDLVLKDTTGDKVIQRLREADEASVVITISGIDNIKTISRVLSIGADDYITKPFNCDLFIARLKTNIRNYLLLREVKIKTELLEKMSVTDSLTELYNRRHIFDRLSQEIEKAGRYKKTFSILMLDIDHFKNINDTYGHQFGDIVLKKVSAIIQSDIRTIDVAGRYGGEEFIVILPEVSVTGAAVVAERIREDVEKLVIDNKKFNFSISIGAAEYTGEDIQDIMKRVDKLLYKAKERGRNCVEIG